MASKYWLKLYHEILDDPKVGRLRITLRWRMIEAFLLAGELDENGFLPSLADMAWRVRVEPELLEAELNELADAGILNRVDGRWLVVNFAARQGASSDAERMREYRKRLRKERKEAKERKEGNTDKEEDIDTDTYRSVTGVTERNAQRNDGRAARRSTLTEVGKNGSSDEKIDNEEQAAWKATQDLLHYWQGLTGSFAPADNGRAGPEYVGPLNQLWIKVGRDTARAKDLLRAKREEMLRTGKTPYRPAAVVPAICADLDAGGLSPRDPDWLNEVVVFSSNGVHDDNP